MGLPLSLFSISGVCGCQSGTGEIILVKAHSLLYGKVSLSTCYPLPHTGFLYVMYVSMGFRSNLGLKCPILASGRPFVGLYLLTPYLLTI